MPSYDVEIEGVKIIDGLNPPKEGLRSYRDCIYKVAPLTTSYPMGYSEIKSAGGNPLRVDGIQTPRTSMVLSVAQNPLEFPAPDFVTARLLTRCERGFTILLRNLPYWRFPSVRREVLLPRLLFHLATSWIFESADSVLLLKVSIPDRILIADAMSPDFLQRDFRNYYVAQCRFTRNGEAR